jgi:hypothetical protein
LAQAVADVLRSPVLEEQVSVWALISSLETTSFGKSDEPVPLTVWNQWEAPNVAGLWPAQLIIGYAPDTWTRRPGTTYSQWGMEYSAGPPDPSVDEVAQWLRCYPRLSALGNPTKVSMHPHIPTDTPAGRPYEKYYVDLEWDALRFSFHDSRRWASSLLDVEQSMIGEACNGIAIPTVGGNPIAQHPLIGWWLALYAFSMLARYFPQEWTRILDVDRSLMATPIEAFLDEARATVPDLVYRALLGIMGAEDPAAVGHEDMSTYGRAAPS